MPEADHAALVVSSPASTPPRKRLGVRPRPPCWRLPAAARRVRVHRSPRGRAARPARRGADRAGLVTMPRTERGSASRLLRQRAWSSTTATCCAGARPQPPRRAAEHDRSGPGHRRQARREGPRRGDAGQGRRSPGGRAVLSSTTGRHVITAQRADQLVGNGLTGRAECRHDGQAADPRRRRGADRLQAVRVAACRSSSSSTISGPGPATSRRRRTAASMASRRRPPSRPALPPDGTSHSGRIRRSPRSNADPIGGCGRPRSQDRSASATRLNGACAEIAARLAATPRLALWPPRRPRRRRRLSPTPPSPQQRAARPASARHRARGPGCRSRPRARPSRSPSARPARPHEPSSGSMITRETTDLRR